MSTAPLLVPRHASFAESAFAGTWSAVRLILRRDRILLPVWILGLAAITSSTAAGVIGLYSLAADRQEWADGVAGNPMELALVGPIFGSSSGAIISWQVGVRSLLGAALASLLMVIRHTRTEEETGRRELLGSTPFGRHAQLAAALLVTAVASCLAGLLTAAALAWLGLPLAGALALGGAIASMGLFFAGVGAVTAQLSVGAGSARGMALIVLAVAYVLRAVDDAGSGDSPLSWLSPFGWAHRVRPFAGERWWVLLLPVIATAVLAGVAIALSARRDIGGGLIASREGPATASDSLRGPLSLAWRQHRTGLAGWAVGFCCAGFALGGIALSVTKQAGQSEQLQELITYLGGEGRPVDGVFALFVYILALAAGAYGVLAALRPHAEEASGRAEPMLAAPVGRARWLGGHLLIAAMGSAALLAVLGLATGLTYGLASGDVPGELARMPAAALAYAPAVWVMIGITGVLYGVTPRAATAGAWTILVLNVLVFLIAQVPGMNPSIAYASPFINVPKLPAAALSVSPLAVLVLIAAVLAAGGLFGFTRRRIT
ncbi:ABC transporter permease [Nonomuraea sp. NPDC049129]|uniref:ABC transporter permease n=1 Tax=Nonomuraea sp. NPDC049129 TaxID=3155272 RepID=UPI00340B8A81